MHHLNIQFAYTRHT